MDNLSLQQARAEVVPRGVASATAIYAARAENAEIWDVEGRRYIDFAGGIAVLNVGHRHPKIIDAVSRQLGQFTHTAFQVAPYPSYIELAQRLNRLAPIEGPAKTVFFTTGAEATENAVKIARSATRRGGVVAFSGGFHGRTLLASAMTGKVLPYKKAAGPFPPEVFHLPFPSPTTGVSVQDMLKALDFLFASDVEPDRIAAFIVEPIQGEGGFHVPFPEFFDVLDRLRERHGILLIADEVQTGFARTGKMFAMEHHAIKPDLIAVAKSLAGGFPLSGVIGRAEVMDAVEPGGLGGTYGGSPVACAAALAVLDVIDEEGLAERAEQIGGIIADRIGRLSAEDGSLIAGLRGKGAMIAFDIVDRDGLPDAARAKQICGQAMEAGLLLLSCGQAGQAIRILVPLTASDELIAEGLDILEAVLTANRGAAAIS
ncbi:4-aminobutyrate--2-oxoglutarate transaminase [Sphingosinicella microcystinivorans]|uniref:4-aminobutyrate--2-oxoglutarate transaminase n=1 Tax=Sphingosinicella microcystinivorans TaxID=335406 RepID=UPI0022F3B3D6|nr:4-aminobutyrate--2-oxoglutarate transaminase [Sphingosinicella microcystinivorans]WBX85804.1 4-aminobutyrate--2-oxoglutarate transaminase [Sphingosinicella microcystinivorans]